MDRGAPSRDSRGGRGGRRAPDDEPDNPQVSFDQIEGLFGAMQEENKIIRNLVKMCWEKCMPGQPGDKLKDSIFFMKYSS